MQEIGLPARDAPLSVWLSNTSRLICRPRLSRKSESRSTISRALQRPISGWMFLLSQCPSLTGRSDHQIVPSLLSFLSRIFLLVPFLFSPRAIWRQVSGEEV